MPVPGCPVGTLVAAGPLWLRDVVDGSGMGSEEPEGPLFFPPQRAGAGAPRRWTRLWLPDALRHRDPDAALAAEREGDWRMGYPAHFRRLIEVALPSGMPRSRWPAAG